MSSSVAGGARKSRCLLCSAVVPSRSPLAYLSTSCDRYSRSRQLCLGKSLRYTLYQLSVTYFGHEFIFMMTPNGLLRAGPSRRIYWRFGPWKIGLEMPGFCASWSGQYLHHHLPATTSSALRRLRNTRLPPCSIHDIGFRCH